MYDDNRTKYLSAADTAKLVREALKECYPGVKFSVRSSTYSMGASIDVGWTDGPSTEEIDALVRPYQGSDFDGMQDLKTSRPAVWVKGERLRFGADYVHTNRSFSAKAWHKALDYWRTFADYPAEADQLKIEESELIGAHFADTPFIGASNLRVGGEWLTTQIYRYLQPLNLSDLGSANGNGSKPRAERGVITAEEIAPGLHHVAGDTFPKRATLKASGGSWDKPSQSWVFVGDLPAEVAALVNGTEAPEPEAPATETEEKGDPVVAKLEKLITSLDGEIADKETPRDWNITARRAAMDESRDHEARRLRKLRRICRALVDQRTADDFPQVLRQLSTRAALESVLAHEALPLFLQEPEDTKRLIRAGLTTDSAIRSARYWIEHLDDVLPSSATPAELATAEAATLAQADQEAERAADLKRKEREILLSPIPGFFPTPAEVVAQMLERADLQPGMTVLEPSAGRGDIADKAAEVVGKAGVDVFEIHSGLRTLLMQKGYLAGGGDFLWAKGGWYDRVLMNPPFEGMQDVDHVMRAYYMLKPGGRLVAIMSESPFFREDHKALMFRDWLCSVEGVDEKMPDGSFKTGPKQTGVACRIVVIDREEL